MTFLKVCQIHRKFSLGFVSLLGFSFLIASPLWAQEKGTIRVCDDIKAPSTLDPQKQFTEKNHTLLQQIYEGLVRFDPNGKIVPLLAVSWKEISPTIMEFHLRENVRFHNGEQFDAESVKFSIDRYLNPQTGFPAQGFIASIKRVTVISPNKIRIETHAPDGLLLNRLAGYILIVPQKYLTENGEMALDLCPIGTGPFRFKGWKDQKKGIELEANNDYWDKTRPKVSTLEFLFLPLENQVKALLDGEIDILLNLPGTQTMAVQRHPSTYVIKVPTLYTTAASFRNDRKPTSLRAVRQALNMAINKQDLVQYDLLGNGRPIATFSMPGELGHNNRLQPYPFDLSKAKKLLEEAGYPNGFSLNVLLKTNAKRTGQIIAKHLSRVGVKLNLTFAADAELMEYMRHREKWDMVIGDVPDVIFHSYFIPAIFLYSQSPFALSKNEEFDQQLAKMASTTDVKLQINLAESLDQFIFEEALALFTCQSIRAYGLRKGVQFVPSVNGMQHFDQATFSEN